MKTLFDHRGKVLRLGKSLGKGGEGEVFRLADYPQFVAKIYHDPLSQAKGIKLRAMVEMASGNSALTSFTAWPLSLLYTNQNAGGQPVGIGLPFISQGHEIHDLYGPKARSNYFPKADWQFLIRVAHCCATAFAILHKNGIVIGDVNQGNVLVFPDGNIRLIDCDSYQILHHGRRFLCEVGVGHFTPPELQMSDFDTVVRTPNHDCFGLAVLIFHLLYVGRHPFAGRSLQPGPPPTIEQAITDHRFAYASWAKRVHMDRPPNTPPLMIVPPKIARMFEDAFGEQSVRSNTRPTAEAWVSALAKFEKSLAKCKTSPAHRYSSHQTSCPWCYIENRGGPDYFIAAALTIRHSGTNFDIQVLWSRVETLNQSVEVSQDAPKRLLSFGPSVSFPSTQIPSIPPKSSTHLSPTNVPPPRGHRTLQRPVSIVAVISMVCLLGSSVLHGVFPFTLVFTVVFTGWWTALVVTSPLWKLRNKRLSEMERARKAAAARRQTYNRLARKHADNLVFLANQRDGLSQLQSKLRSQAEKQWLDRRNSFIREKDELYQQLARIRGGYLGIPQAERKLIDELNNHAKERALEEFLRRHLIRNATIPGIGPARLATLEAYGIESALDISGEALSVVPGIGNHLTGNLIAWRGKTAKRFSHTGSPPQTDVNNIRARTEFQRRNYERQFHEIRANFEQAVHRIKASDGFRPDVNINAYQKGRVKLLSAIDSLELTRQQVEKAARGVAVAQTAFEQTKVNLRAFPSVWKIIMP